MIASNENVVVFSKCLLLWHQDGTVYAAIFFVLCVALLLTLKMHYLVM